MTKEATWLGPYTFDEDHYYVRRRGPSESPRLGQTRWDILEADPEDRTRPRVGLPVAVMDLPTGDSDARALYRLFGKVLPVVYKPGWGPDGALPTVASEATP